MTHDYVRHGTTTLFAALNVADGQVIGECQPRHRHQEWLKFLQKIDAQTPPDRPLHLILDNYATHKHSRVKAWLFHSVPELVQPLQGYLQHHNQAPAPFIWTAQAKDILMKVKRARKKLQACHKVQ